MLTTAPSLAKWLARRSEEQTQRRLAIAEITRTALEEHLGVGRRRRLGARHVKTFGLLP